MQHIIQPLYLVTIGSG